MKNKIRLTLPEGITELTASEYQRLIDGRPDTGATEPERENKYKNQKVLTSDGFVFDSRKEARRYDQLLLMKRQGLIINFERQVKFILLESVPKLFRSKSYVADFVVEYADGRKEVEDVKSDFTRKDRVYKLKKHLLYITHNILIKEII